MTIVATRSGKIEGLEGEGVQVFRGIPYAAPPIGSRRWRPPVLEDAWDGVREAKAFGAQSAQTEFAMTKMDDVHHPECELYVEDERAAMMLSEIVTATDSAVKNKDDSMRSRPRGEAETSYFHGCESSWKNRG